MLEGKSINKGENSQIQPMPEVLRDKVQLGTNLHIASLIYAFVL